jgi:hypothetical protein
MPMCRAMSPRTSLPKAVNNSIIIYMSAEAAYSLPEEEPSEKEVIAGRILSKTISLVSQEIDVNDTGLHTKTRDGLHIAIDTALPLESEPIVGKDYIEPKRVIELGERLDFNEAKGLPTKVWERLGKGSRRIIQLPGWEGEKERREGPSDRRTALDLKAQTQLRPFTIEAEDRKIRLQGMLYSVWYTPQPRRVTLQRRPIIDRDSLKNLSEDDLAVLEERADVFAQSMRGK